MFLTGFTLVVELRGLIPATILTCSIIPYSSAVLILETFSFALPRKWTRKLRNEIYKNYLRTTLFIFENVSRVKINLYGDADEILNNYEAVITLSNHLSSDWAAITMLATRHSKNGIEFRLHFLLKYVIHFIPLFGWGLFQKGNIFVRRFGKFMAQPVIKQLQYLTFINEPFWLNIFPEGTRFKTKLLAESQAYSLRNHLPVLKHTLSPRTKGFHLALQELRERLDCVYDLTIAYANKSNKIQAPGMFEFCCGSEPYSLHIHVRRYPINTIPTQIIDQKIWLFKRFAEKDQLLEEFYKNGTFSKKYNQNPLYSPLLRNLVPFLCFSSAAALSLFSKRLRIVYLGTIGISPFLIAWLHLKKLI